MNASVQVPRRIGTFPTCFGGIWLTLFCRYYFCVVYYVHIMWSGVESALVKDAKLLYE